jgi:hypothetical protein
VPAHQLDRLVEGFNAAIVEIGSGQAHIAKVIQPSASSRT